MCKSAHLSKCLLAEFSHSHKHEDVLLLGLYHGWPLLPHALHYIVGTQGLRDVLCGGRGGRQWGEGPNEREKRDCYKCPNTKIIQG